MWKRLLKPSTYLRSFSSKLQPESEHALLQALKQILENLVLFQTKEETQVKFWRPYRLNESTLVMPIRINKNLVHAIQLSPLNIQEGQQIESIQESETSLVELSLAQDHKSEISSEESKKRQKRLPICKQLFSGHLRIDMCNPLAQSNFILLKGPSNSGKLGFVLDVISSFISESEENLAILVTLKTAKIKELENSKQVIVLQQEGEVNSGRSLLQFRAALQIAKAHRRNKNVLLIFDSLVDYFLKEIEVYDEAGLPFSHFNLMNEASTLTGRFEGERGTLTSIGIIDTDKETLDLQLKLNRFISSAESVSDHVVEFEPTRVQLKKTKPTLDTKPQQKYLHDSWINENLRPLMKQLRELNDRVDKAYQQSTQRKSLKVPQDPWDNYLMHDSKYFIKLLAHPGKMRLSDQILVAQFVLFSVKDQSIAEYKEPAQIMLSRLLKFTRQFQGFETDQGRAFQKQMTQGGQVEVPNLRILKKDLEVLFKMFHLSEKVEGRLRQYKNDYFA